jgi:hypothetical protein
LLASRPPTPASHPRHSSRSTLPRRSCSRPPPGDVGIICLSII